MKSSRIESSALDGGGSAASGIMKTVLSLNMAKKLPNVHPGEVLLEEFLEPLELSQNRLARAMGVPPRRINEIVLGKRKVTPDTALRLSRYFGTSSRFWLGLQLDYDLEEAEREKSAKIEREVQPRENVGA